MVINFKNIDIKDIEGNVKTVDISKDLANVLYSTAVSKEGLDIAKEIYNNGETDVDKTLAEAIQQLIKGNFLAVVQEALDPVLSSIIEEAQEPTAEEISINTTTKQNCEYEQCA